MGYVILPEPGTEWSLGIAGESSPVERAAFVGAGRVHVVSCETLGGLPNGLLGFDQWIYQVLPIGEIAPDPGPEFVAWNSMTCESALVLDVLREPLL